MKILVIASGGDAPGMNMVLSTLQKKFKDKIFAVEGGFKGLYENKIFPLSNYPTKKYQDQAGCVIKSSRFPQLKQKRYFDKAAKNLQGFSNIIILGGNGSFKACQNFEKLGFKIHFIPCTIDNDVEGCECSTGFLTATRAVCNTICNVMPSMEAFNRCCIFEVMGRYCSAIADLSSQVLPPDFLILNKEDYDQEKVLKIIKEKQKQNKSSFIILRENVLQVEKVCKELNEILKDDVVKFHIVGHIQRGFKPIKQELELAKNISLKIIREIV